MSVAKCCTLHQKKVIPWFVPRHLKCVVNNANAGDEEILQNGP